MSFQTADEFISRWANATPSDRANGQLFLSELCDLLQLPHRDATVVWILRPVGGLDFHPSKSD